MLFEEGLENVFQRHRLLAEAVRRAVGVWAEGQAIGFNIIEPAERSDTVTDGADERVTIPCALRAYCNEKCGVVLGVGHRRARTARRSASPIWATSTRR